MKSLKLSLLILIIFSSITFVFAQEINITIDSLKPPSTLDSTLIVRQSLASFGGIEVTENNKNGFFNPTYCNQQGLDAGRLMQSKIAGLSVLSNSYSPGGSSSMLFRGHRSFYGSNEPLIILDGIPIQNKEWNNSNGGTDQSNRLMDIDPNIIERIDFTNSSFDRARYGIVGANGVLHITTKKGAFEKTKITYRSTIGIDEVSRLPELQDTYGSGRIDNGSSIYRGPQTFETSSWGPRIDDLVFDGNTMYPFDTNGELFVANGSIGQRALRYNPYEVFEKGMTSNHSIQITGNQKNINYATTLSTFNQTGVIPTSKYDRYNLSTSIGTVLKDKLSIQLNTHFSLSNSIRNQKGSNLYGIMLATTRTPFTFDNSFGLSNPLDNEASYIYQNELHRSSSNGIYSNPYWSLNKTKHEDSVNRQILSLSTGYEFNESLHFYFTVGRDQFKDNRVGGIDINPNWYSGSAYDRNLNFASNNIDLVTDYKVIDNDLWNISTSLNLNYNENRSDFIISEGTDLSTSNDVSIDNLISLETYEYSEELKRSTAGLSFNAVYNNYLRLTGVISQSGSNKFGKLSSGFLSYGLGTNISLTELMNASDSNQEENPLSINIHASYGRLGNFNAAPLGYGRYTSTIISGDGFIPNTPIENPEVNNTLRSDYLTAEKTSSYDVGIDMAWKPMNLYFSATYYNESSSGLILTDDIASSSGFQFLESNLGSMSNQGIDLSLIASPLKTNHLEWELRLDFNKNINRVKNIGTHNSELFLSGFSTTAISSIKSDFAYGSIYGTAFLRNENDQMIIGDDGFPIPTNERKVIGDPNPDWTMYLNNTFKIGNNVSINLLVDFKQGGDLYCGTCATLDYLGKSKLSADERGTTTVFEGVTETGISNTQSVELALESGTYNDFFRRRYGFSSVSELNIFDASWIRLRSVSMEYNLSQLIKIKFLESLSIGIFAQNLLVISDYPGIDPETNLAGNSGGLGIDYYNNPGTKRYGFTFKASF